MNSCYKEHLILDLQALYFPQGIIYLVRTQKTFSEKINISSPQIRTRTY